jgi:hypothetical protein
MTSDQKREFILIILFILISTERCFYNSAIIISPLIKIKTFGGTELFHISLSGKFKMHTTHKPNLGTAVSHLLVQPYACAAECTALCCSRIHVLLSVLYFGTAVCMCCWRYCTLVQPYACAAECTVLWCSRMHVLLGVLYFGTAVWTCCWVYCIRLSTWVLSEGKS